MGNETANASVLKSINALFVPRDQPEEATCIDRRLDILLLVQDLKAITNSK
jgi:hypothetical protein